MLDYLRPDAAAQVVGLSTAATHDRRAIHRVLHRDGSDHWLDTHTKALCDDDQTVIEVISICRDVSAATQAQHALADSEEKFRYAFDDAPTGMVLSGLDGRIWRVNPAFATMLGRKASDLVASTVADITHPDDRDQDQANLHELAARTTNTHQVVKRYVHQDGSPVPAEVRATAVNDRHGTIAYVLAHITQPPAVA